MKVTNKFQVITLMILIAALSRILPHPYNFTPLVAMALFSGATFDKKWMAYIMPLLAYLLSDLVMSLSGARGFYGISQLFVYGGMILVTALGTTLRQPKALKLLGYSLTGSAIFWIVSNFGVWVASGIAGSIEYEPGLTLGMTYLRALPFYNQFSNQLFLGAFGGDLFYTAVLFGVYALAQKRLPSLRYSKA
ncbi:DUF6580 family putative transport protein [Niabella beijingensis]|uniref:DUF6580 family putative transport protein n=1 Tax=Niabella beijingensis TaxID=2872700 RepID=UPI001CBD4A76|nr:DUF6580 family putative transport protein [Niabella beijingensis]MBZ4188767.1 hypothetical protein [Niabella beijingensis]